MKKKFFQLESGEEKIRIGEVGGLLGGGGVGICGGGPCDGQG